MTLDLLSLPGNSLENSIGGDISSFDSDTQHPDPIKALARRLGRPRPSTPPGTTSGAGSSTTDALTAPELGCAQNSDRTLCDAADVKFFFDPNDDVPMPAVQRAPIADIQATTPASDSPFLSPVNPAPAVPSSLPTTLGGVRSAPLASPPDATIADAAAAAGRARQARAAAASSPASPIPRRSAAACVCPRPADYDGCLNTHAHSHGPARPSTHATTNARSTPLHHRSHAEPGKALRGGPTPLPSQGDVHPPAPRPRRRPYHKLSNPDKWRAHPRPLPTLPQITPSNAVQPPTGAGLAPADAPQPAPQPLGAQPLGAQPITPAVAGAPTPRAGTPGTPAHIAPTAAAATLGGVPLPVYCHVPLDIAGIYSPDSLTAHNNSSPLHLSKWDALTGGKFLVYEWNSKPHSIDSTAVEDIKSAITCITGTAPLVGPPVAANPANRSAPFMYLVRGVSDADSQLLLLRRVWNLVGGTTFFAIPYNAPSSSFLFTLDGFSFGADDGIEVADLVVSVIYEDHNAQTFLAINHDNYPADVDPMSHFAASVRVSPVSFPTGGGRSRIAWNVTATPPSAEAANNCAWVSALSSIKSQSTMHWVGKTVSPPHLCSGCKSLGHTFALCPLPKLTGWYSKPAATSPTGPPPAGNGGNGGQRPKDFRGNTNGRNRGRNNYGGQVN
ncbi:hypothetical protein DFH09DRAFT_1348808 [Mycena vulgaris]|nr:hypothetical protein DFH09DRAFT_1348808 [Mycena vulgaris]